MNEPGFDSSANWVLASPGKQRTLGKLDDNPEKIARCSLDDPGLCLIIAGVIRVEGGRNDSNATSPFAIGWESRR